MKLFFTLLLSVTSLTAFTQSHDDMLKGLKKYKSGQSTPAEVIEKRKEDKVVSVSKEKVGTCDEDTASIPLSFLSGLLISSDDLIIEHNPRTMVMTVKTGNMISNCNDMIEWDVVETKIGTDQVYGVKAKIKSCETTAQSPNCKYSIKDRSSGKTVTRKDVPFPPTFDGFKDCLVESKVFDKSTSQIVSANVQSGSDNFYHKINASGRVMFVTHGMDAPNFAPMYDQTHEKMIDCNYFENIADGGKVLKSQDEIVADKRAAELLILQKQHDDLKDKCTVSDYLKVSESFEKVNDFSKDMIKLIDPLIRLAAQEVAKAMSDPDYVVTDADLKVIADFEKLVVQERVKDAINTYNEMVEADSPLKEELKKELDIIVADLKSLDGGKYFTSKMVDQLLANGKFDSARDIHSMKLKLSEHAKLGVGKSSLNPAGVANVIIAAEEDFESDIEIEREKYAYKTGEDSGLAEYYSDLSAQMRQNVITRTSNYTEELQAEYARMQPGGYCFRYYFRNANKCMQNSQLRIQELQAELAHFNNVDSERAGEFDVKAQEYEVLEQEGRTYLANQGKEVEAPSTVKSREVASAEYLSPERNINQSYSFDFNQGNQGYQAQSQQMNPYANNNMFQQPQNPWGMSTNYQQPWMGQQSYNLNGNFGMQGGMYQQGINPYPSMGKNSYGFNWGSGQQQTPWQQSGYNNYSMY